MSNNTFDDFDEEYSFKSDSGSDNHSPVDCVKQIKSFARLTETNTDEWVACDFEKTATKDEQGRIQYQFTGKDTEGYTDITPFFDNIDERRKDRIIAEHIHNKKLGDKTKAWGSCQYCGHGFVYVFKIKHDEKKLIMTIGSHCVKRFTKVDDVSLILKKDEEKTLRNAITRWRVPTVRSIWEKPDHIKENYLAKDGSLKPILYDKYYRYQQLLSKVNNGEIPVKEIKEIFRKAKKLNLDIPFDVDELITRKPKSNRKFSY